MGGLYNPPHGEVAERYVYLEKEAATAPVEALNALQVEPSVEIREVEVIVERENPVNEALQHACAELVGSVQRLEREKLELLALPPRVETVEKIETVFRTKISTMILSAAAGATAALGLLHLIS